MFKVVKDLPLIFIHDLHQRLPLNHLAKHHIGNVAITNTCAKNVTIGRIRNTTSQNIQKYISGGPKARPCYVELHHLLSRLDLRHFWYVRKLRRDNQFKDRQW
jgi:hypothetical protein